MGVDVVAGQLLDHALGFVQRQELSDADTDEGGKVGILELGVHLANRLPERLHLLQQLVDILTAGQSSTGAQNGVEHRAKLGGQLRQFRESLLEDGGELEEAESVAGGRSVENDNLVGQGLDLLQDLSEGHGFVNTGDLVNQSLANVSSVMHARKGHGAWSVR